MLFIDQTEVFVKSGAGGRGLVSFRAAKYEPKAGADGGDGGFGGNVFLVGDKRLSTLSHLRHRQVYKATDGMRGGPNNRTGKSGEDLVIYVPLGTVAKRSPLEDENSSDFLCEILEDQIPILIARGGKRGLGNYRFLSSTHQAPEESTPGGSGEEFLLQLELKLLADVGFAGFPSVGKSTLLSTISSARPKIGDYPFTTLTPQLGVVSTTDSEGRVQSFVAADIPGLIEGASCGRGLGLDFLRHLERTRVIAYLLDPGTLEQTAEEQFEILRREISVYSREMAKKPAIIVLTKADIFPDRSPLTEVVASLETKYSLPTFVISSATHEGTQDLCRALYVLIQNSLSVSETHNEDNTRIEFESPRGNRPTLDDFVLMTQ